MKKPLNNKLKTALIILITAVLSAAITSAVFLVIIKNMRSDADSAMATADSASPGSAVTQTAPTQLNEPSDSQAAETNGGADIADFSSESTGVPVTAPDELKEMAAAVTDDIASFGFDQLITVQSEGSSATLSFYEKTNGAWSLAAIAPADGFVGSGGVSSDANEYSPYTPFGLHALGTGFGVKENPGTAMPYFTVTESSYWVDDPASSYYNQHVEGTSDRDWDSAEHLIDYQPNYNYAVFIEYNTSPAVPGNGSAFFIHVGTAPTVGCVAVSEDKMVDILQWLDPAKAPHILIL